MANGLFPAGILVSGTLSKKTYTVNGQKRTCRAVAMVRNGKQRIYLREDKPRATAPSEAELRQRQRFARVMAAYSALSPEELRRYQEEGHRDQWRFNGKQYRSPAGYIKARIYNSVLVNDSRTARE